MNTSAPWDTRSHHLILPFASVSHSPSVISKAFRSSVKQLHHDFSGRPRRYLLLPLTRLPRSKALGRWSSCWRGREPANRSHGVVEWSFPRSHIRSWPESPRTITGGRSVGASGSLHTVEGVDGAGCGGDYTLSSVQVLHPYSRASRTSIWSIRTFSAIGTIAVGRS